MMDGNYLNFDFHICQTCTFRHLYLYLYLHFQTFIMLLLLSKVKPPHYDFIVYLLQVDNEV